MKDPLASGADRLCDEIAEAVDGVADALSHLKLVRIERVVLGFRIPTAYAQHVHRRVVNRVKVGHATRFRLVTMSQGEHVSVLRLESKLA